MESFSKPEQTFMEWTRRQGQQFKAARLNKKVNKEKNTLTKQT